MGDISQIVTFCNIESLYVVLDAEPLLWTRLMLEGSLGMRSHIEAGDRLRGRSWLGPTVPPSWLTAWVLPILGNSTVAARNMTAVASVSNEKRKGWECAKDMQRTCAKDICAKDIPRQRPCSERGGCRRGGGFRQAGREEHGPSPSLVGSTEVISADKCRASVRQKAVDMSQTNRQAVLQLA
jgi:hypothetical protein